MHPRVTRFHTFLTNIITGHTEFRKRRQMGADNWLDHGSNIRMYDIQTKDIVRGPWLVKTQTKATETAVYAIQYAIPLS
ncbi:hypothetical protein GCM10028816_42830 [Spirosoma lituiforme]